VPLTLLLTAACGCQDAAIGVEPHKLLGVTVTRLNQGKAADWIHLEVSGVPGQMAEQQQWLVVAVETEGDQRAEWLP
jgi:hypothetical protein